jgi:hypothetical protein
MDAMTVFVFYWPVLTGSIDKRQLEIPARRNSRQLWIWINSSAGGGSVFALPD